MMKKSLCLSCLSVAGTGATSTCLSNSFIKRMDSTFECRDWFEKMGGKKSELGDGSCHVQGVATSGSGLALTCMGKSDDYGHVAWYEHPASYAAVTTVKKAVGSDSSAKHPSATQLLDDGTLPVAFSLPSNDGPATIRFFTTSDGLTGPTGEAIEHHDSHMGALGFAKIDGAYHIVGCGWSCEQLAVWTSLTSPTEGYSRTFYTSNTHSVVDSSGVDDNVGEYNSLFLTTRCDDGAVLLVATHSTWMDVWELTGLGSQHLKMKKLKKRHISESVVKHGLNDIFKEGVTLVPSEDGNNAKVYASPHDFGTSGWFYSCEKNEECTAYVYECSFGSSSSSTASLLV